MRKLIITIGIILGLSSAGAVAASTAASASDPMHYHGSAVMHFHL